MKELRVFAEMIEIQGMNLELQTSAAPRARFSRSTPRREKERSVRSHSGTRWKSCPRRGQVHSYLNGTLVSVVTHHEFKEPGYLGFQSEGAKIYWRNIRIREE
jgi:hypothetical protein